MVKDLILTPQDLINSGIDAGWYINFVKTLRTDDQACIKFCEATLAVSIYIGSERVWPRG